MRTSYSGGMDIHSLGIRTDLMFHRFRGEVHDRDDCLMVRTPTNPGYRWGNMLLFADPPRAGDLQRWEERFVAELGGEYRHRVFGWDIDPADPLADRRGHIDPFLAAGYHFGTNEILASGARELRPPDAVHPQLEIRPLHSDSEWREVIDLQVLCRDEREGEAGYRRFRERAMAGYRRMQRDGRGAWFAGYLGGRPVADMGLFFEQGVGRYQHVETHPEYRRQGIASTMVHGLARNAFERRGASTLVIAADPDGPAAALYKRLGFALRELTFGLELIDIAARM